LLCVRLADEGHRAGTVEPGGPSLFLGYVSRFGYAEGFSDTAYDEWLEVCQRAFRLRHSLEEQAALQAVRKGERAEDEPVYAFLRELFADLFPGQTIMLRAELTAADVVGWDSFKHVEILVALEQKFGIRIRPREVASLEKIGELVELVQKKRHALQAEPSSSMTLVSE
jgi:acyl carrier protein